MCHQIVQIKSKVDRMSALGPQLYSTCLPHHFRQAPRASPLAGSLGSILWETFSVGHETPQTQRKRRREEVADSAFGAWNRIAQSESWFLVQTLEPKAKAFCLVRFCSNVRHTIEDCLRDKWISVNKSCSNLLLQYSMHTVRRSIFSSLQLQLYFHEQPLV